MEEEESKIFWIAFTAYASLIAIMLLMIVLFPNPHPGTLPLAGDVYIITYH
jgi:hypothetical protein